MLSGRVVGLLSLLHCRLGCKSAAKAFESSLFASCPQTATIGPLPSLRMVGGSRPISENETRGKLVLRANSASFLHAVSTMQSGCQLMSIAVRHKVQPGYRVSIAHSAMAIGEGEGRPETNVCVHVFEGQRGMRGAATKPELVDFPEPPRTLVNLRIITQPSRYYHG